MLTQRQDKPPEKLFYCMSSMLHMMLNSYTKFWTIRCRELFMTTGLFLKIREEINKIKFNYQSLMETQTKIIIFFP